MLGVGWAAKFASTTIDYCETGESITTEGAGGDDAIDIEFLKQQAPLRVRSNFKLVTLEDYQTLLRDVAGVQDSFSVDYLTDKKTYGSSFGVPVNSVYTWILPETGGELSPDLRQIITSYLDDRRLTAIDNFVFNPPYTNVAFNAKIYYSKFVSDRSVIEDAIRKVIDDNYGIAASRFGRDIRLTQIIGLIQAIEGVKYMQLNAPVSDITLQPYQVARILPTMVTLDWEKVS